MGEVLNYYHIGKMIPDGAVYIGRAMPHYGLAKSKFANPFKLTKDEPRGTTLDKYKSWLWNEIRLGNITVNDLAELKDKDLVCFCHPKPCHGDILIRAVQWATKQIPC